MPRLTIATLAAPIAMGQQVYEQAIITRAAAELGTQWRVGESVVRTLRSPLDGTARLPSYLLGAAPRTFRSAAGRVLYRGSDVVHRMDLRLPPAGSNEVLMIHDVVSWRFPDEGTAPRHVVAEARRSEIVVCPSSFSAGEIVEVLGTREPVVIPNGVDAALFDAVPLPDASLAELGVHRPYVLHAGGCSQRKNLPALAAAWAVLSESAEAQLVLVGPRDARRDRLFDPLPNTVSLGRVETGQLRGLMCAAAAVVVPSLYEGFGLPALEAMACGTPVVAAATSSLPEVCGDAALLVTPDGDGLAAGLEAALADGAEMRDLAARGRRRAASFRWEHSVARHAELWRSVAS